MSGSAIRGAILYEGPSLIDGKPIVAVAAGFLSARKNRKTGAGISTYIIRSDMPPNKAALSGDDVSVCGDCPLRPAISGVCYVELGHGAWNVYRGYQNGSYRRNLPPSIFSDRYVRLGTYGDPAAVPLDVWRTITDSAANWSGYTHRWKTCDQGLHSILMASVDSDSEATEAQSLGWRTFRLRLASSPLRREEIVCPSSDEGGHRRQCNSCRACRGNGRSGQAKSVSIVIHGRPWKAAQFRRLELSVLTLE